MICYWHVFKHANLYFCSQVVLESRKFNVLFELQLLFFTDQTTCDVTRSTTQFIHIVYLVKAVTDIILLYIVVFYSISNILM